MMLKLPGDKLEKRLPTGRVILWKDKFAVVKAKKD